MLYICTGKKGGKDLFKLASAYAKHHHKENIEVVRTECTDRCEYAPVCAVQPGNTWLKEYHEKEVLKLLGLIP